MSSHQLVYIMLFMLHTYACFASRNLPLPLKQSHTLNFKEAKTIDIVEATRGTSTTAITDRTLEFQLITNKMTVQGMDPESDKLKTIKMQDTKKNERSMIESGHESHGNASSNGDESAGEVIQEKDYKGPSGGTPIHNHKNEP